MQPTFPLPLDAYPRAHGSIFETLSERISIEPFNAVATGVFFLAILHTFVASRFAAWARRIQQRHDERTRLVGGESSPSVSAEIMHFLGEIEVVFGLWAVVLLAAMTSYAGWESATHYVNDTVN